MPALTSRPAACELPRLPAEHVDLAALVREHGPALRAVALRLTGGNAAEAADLVQDTFERATRNLHRFQPGSNARAWLCTILRNLFIDRCRAAGPPLERADDHELPAREPEPEPAWARISGDDLARAVRELPAEFRVVYDLATVENLSYPEIGARLGVPRNTVATRLLRARQKLRELLLGADKDPS